MTFYSLILLIDIFIFLVVTAVCLFFVKVLQHSTEYLSYFRTVENLFANLVPARVQAKLLIPVFTERSETLIARLPKESLDDYTKVRDYLLREFRLTPENYRDKF